MSELCVSGAYNLKFTNVSPGAATASGDPVLIEITGPVKIKGKAVIINMLLWIITDCSFSGSTHVIGVGSITAAMAKKTTILKMKPLLKGDQGTCSGVFVNNATGAFIPCSCKIEIDDAGQTVVKEK